MVIRTRETEAVFRYVKRLELRGAAGFPREPINDEIGVGDGVAGPVIILTEPARSFRGGLPLATAERTEVVVGGAWVERGNLGLLTQLGAGSPPDLRRG